MHLSKQPLTHSILRNSQSRRQSQTTMSMMMVNNQQQEIINNNNTINNNNNNNPVVITMNNQHIKQQQIQQQHHQRVFNYQNNSQKLTLPLSQQQHQSQYTQLSNNNNSPIQHTQSQYIINSNPNLNANDMRRSQQFHHLNQQQSFNKRTRENIVVCQSLPKTRPKYSFTFGQRDMMNGNDNRIKMPRQSINKVQQKQKQQQQQHQQQQQKPTFPYSQRQQHNITTNKLSTRNIRKDIDLCLYTIADKLNSQQQLQQQTNKQTRQFLVNKLHNGIVRQQHLQYEYRPSFSQLRKNKKMFFDRSIHRIHPEIVQQYIETVYREYDIPKMVRQQQGDIQSGKNISGELKIMQQSKRFIAQQHQQQQQRRTKTQQKRQPQIKQEQQQRVAFQQPRVKLNPKLQTQLISFQQQKSNNNNNNKNNIITRFHYNNQPFNHHHQSQYTLHNTKQQQLYNHQTNNNTALPRRNNLISSSSQKKQQTLINNSNKNQKQKRRFLNLTLSKQKKHNQSFTQFKIITTQQQNNNKHSQKNNYNNNKNKQQLQSLYQSRLSGQSNKSISNKRTNSQKKIMQIKKNISEWRDNQHQYQERYSYLQSPYEMICNQKRGRQWQGKYGQGLENNKRLQQQRSSSRVVNVVVRPFEEMMRVGVKEQSQQQQQKSQQMQHQQSKQTKQPTLLTNYATNTTTTQYITHPTTSSQYHYQQMTNITNYNSQQQQSNSNYKVNSFFLASSSTNPHNQQNYPNEIVPQQFRYCVLCQQKVLTVNLLKHEQKCIGWIDDHGQLIVYKHLYSMPENKLTQVIKTKTNQIYNRVNILLKKLQLKQQQQTTAKEYKNSNTLQNKIISTVTQLIYNNSQMQLNSLNEINKYQLQSNYEKLNKLIRNDQTLVLLEQARKFCWFASLFRKLKLQQQ